LEVPGAVEIIGLRFLDLLIIEGVKNFVTRCIKKCGLTYIGVGSITSLITNGEVLLKYLFFQSCQGILKLTDSQLRTVKNVMGDEFVKGFNLELHKELGLFICCKQVNGWN
jgi:hypothetical protein